MNMKIEIVFEGARLTVEGEWSEYGFDAGAILAGGVNITELMEAGRLITAIEDAAERQIKYDSDEWSLSAAVLNRRAA